MRHYSTTFVYCMLFICMGSLDAFALTSHWTNAAGGNWSVGSNWDNGVPSTDDDSAMIDLAGTYTVTVDLTVEVEHDYIP